jgi:hypothetical protein
MLRTRNDQPSLWESVLPEVCLRLPAELERVDAWLDDERFFAPFRAHFDARLGRPSLPLETYLRLMFPNYAESAIMPSRAPHVSPNAEVEHGGVAPGEHAGAVRRPRGMLPAGPSCSC